MSNSQTNAARYSLIERYGTDVSGATAIEYGLVSALIGVLCITGASALGHAVNGQFIDILKALKAPPADPPQANGSF